MTTQNATVAQGTAGTSETLETLMELMDMLFNNPWLETEDFEAIQAIVCKSRELGITQEEVLSHLESLIALQPKQRQNVLQNAVDMRLLGPNRKQLRDKLPL